MKYIYIVVLLLILESCKDTQNKDTQLIPVYNKVEIDKSVYDLYVDFLKRNNPYNINLLFIDKISPNEKKMYFVSRVSVNNYFNNNYKDSRPLFVTYINKRKVFVFSGIEDVFKGSEENSFASSIYDTSSEATYYQWTIIYNNKHFTIDSSDQIPFMYSKPKEVKKEYVPNIH
jgi:hypothetical protein